MVGLKAIWVVRTESAVNGGAAIYRRVDEDEEVIEVSVDDVGDDVAYIIVDHRTRKVACGITEEQARRNLSRVRGTAPAR